MTARMQWCQKVLAGFATLSLVGLCGCGGSAPSQAVPHATPVSTTTAAGFTTTTVAPTTSTTNMSQLTIEPCGGITENVTSRPNVSLEGYLLTDSDVPSGYSAPKPMTTVGTHFSASVPSIVPVAYINFGTPIITPQPDQLSTSSSGISEAIGEVGSAQMAAQVVVNTDARAAQGPASCNGERSAGVLPGPVPDLVAIEEGGGGTSAGSLDVAYVVASKGAYVVSIMMANQTTVNAGASGSAVAAPPPSLPAPDELATIMDAALAQIPG